VLRSIGRVAVITVLVALTACTADLDREIRDRRTPIPRATPSAIAEEPVRVPSRSVFGFNSHIASRYPDFATLDQPLRVARELGAGWVREDVQWSRVEPIAGQLDWSWHDRVFRAHRQNGTNIIGVIGPAVGWATPYPDDGARDVSFYPPDPEQYARFAGQVAARYRGLVTAWEIWNEPENAIFWRPAPDPVAYTQMLIAASAAIKAADPDATVLSGGVVPYDPTFLEAVAAAGGWNSFDALSIHPYVDPFTPEAAQIDVVGITNVRRLTDRFGAKPIWVTEFGWGTGSCERDPEGLTSEMEQANYLVRGAVMLRSAGAERVLWYNFKDHPGTPCYGLIRGGAVEEDYTNPKPSATALRVLSTEIGSATPLGEREIMTSHTVLTFDDLTGWGTPFPAHSPLLSLSDAQIHGGTGAALVDYRFDDAGNDYAAFPRTVDTPLPADTTRIGLWVYGDASGHMVHVRVADDEGEVLQYRLGFIGTTGWQFLSAPITGEVERGNRIKPGNGRLDGAMRIHGLVVDDHPNEAGGEGTIYVDDLTAFAGTEVYDHRFQDGDEVVDVVWSMEEQNIDLMVDSTRVTITDRDGIGQTLVAENAHVTLTVGPAPIYVRQLVNP
jgi:polysaccharide biosynthesis protein PslG